MTAVVHYYWLVKADVSRPLTYAAVVAVLLGFRVYWSRMKAASTDPRAATCRPSRVTGLDQRQSPADVPDLPAWPPGLTCPTPRLSRSIVIRPSTCGVISWPRYDLLDRRDHQ